MLVDAARVALASQPMKPLAALAVAQRVLPKDRRRKVIQAGKVAWFVQAIRTSPAAMVPQQGLIRAGGARPRANGDAVALIAQGLSALFADAIEQGIALALERSGAGRRAEAAAGARQIQKKRAKARVA